MGNTTANCIDRAGRGADALIRWGIRTLLKQRLDSLPLDDPEAASGYLAAFLNGMAAAPVALVPDKANEQHYELPPALFGLALGARRKYSCCYWPDVVESLDEAETESLRVSCERAGLDDGQTVLELGCGWGSLSLWMAEHYPASRITAVSNSHSQREYISGRAKELGLANLEVITCDMNAFDTEVGFDRVVSVEMFEHMRNWQTLLGRVAGWMKPGGVFLKHIFCHRSVPYEFTVQDESDWMSRYFLSGSIMPSYDLPLYFQDRLKLTGQWAWNGRHYELTSNACLTNMDRQKALIWPILADTYDETQALT